MRQARSPSTGGRRGERGSLTAELVVLAPVVVLFALLAVGLGRYQAARQEVTDAAHAGGEAASLAAAAAGAGAAAQETATAALGSQLHMCRSPIVTTDVSNFGSGGSVRVTVVCHVDLSDLLVPGFPGEVSVTATQVAPVDPFRMVR